MCVDKLRGRHPSFSLNMLYPASRPLQPAFRDHSSVGWYLAYPLITPPEDEMVPGSCEPMEVYFSGSSLERLMRMGGWVGG
jgi:hypothetical protein